MGYMSILGKGALAGAGIGALVGGMSDNGTALGGAMTGAALGAGATFGGLYARGRYINNRVAKMMGVPQPIKKSFGEKIGVARYARKAIGVGMKAARAGARVGAAGYYGKYGTTGYLAGGSVFRASSAIGTGLSAANRYIGKNVAAVNKYGGYAVAGIGAASAGYIGSSVLSSNRRR